MTKSIRLHVLPELYAVSRLDASDSIPDWADGEGFVSISRGPAELSIVCREERVPTGIKSDRGWRCLAFVGPFAFGETGIVLSVIKPLSEAQLGVFVVSTFDADFMLLKLDDFETGLRVLAAAGHRIEPA